MDVLTLPMPSVAGRARSHAAISSTRDRRGTPRFLARQCRARVSWRESSMRLHVCPARLVDISETGARLEFTDEPAEAITELWVSLGDAPIDWVRADVRYLRGDRARKRWWLHVAFAQGRQADLIEKATKPDRP